MLFGVYLLIRKRAVLRYIFRLLAVDVSLLANIDVLKHILKKSQKKRIINVRDSALIAWRTRSKKGYILTELSRLSF
jgi:hypothetical protein